MIKHKLGIPAAASALIAAVALTACAGGQSQISLPSAPPLNAMPSGAIASPGSSHVTRPPRKRNATSEEVQLEVPDGTSGGILIQFYPQGKDTGTPLATFSDAIPDSANCPNYAQSEEGGQPYECIYQNFAGLNNGTAPVDVLFTAYNVAPNANGSFPAGAQIVGTGFTRTTIQNGNYVSADFGSPSNMAPALSANSVDQLGSSTVSVVPMTMDNENPPQPVALISNQQAIVSVSPAPGFSFSGAGANGSTCTPQYAWSSCTLNYNGSDPTAGTVTVSASEGNASGSATITVEPPVFNMFSSGLSAGAQPFGITAVGNGIWFTDRGYTSAIGNLMDVPGSTITEYDLPAPQQLGKLDPATLAVDTSANELWFTEPSQDAMDSISQSGLFGPNESLPNNNYLSVASSGVVVGPDNRVYVTQAYVGQSGLGLQIDAWSPSSGSIQGYSLPRNSSNNYPNDCVFYPYGLAFDHYGYLWVTSPFSDQIWEMTTSGLTQSISLPASARTPGAIALGSDNNMWITDYEGHQIWQIKAGGVATAFALPNGGKPADIVAGAVNLWFTDPVNNAVGKITPAGVITEYPTGVTNGKPSQLTVGGDHNVWYTDSGTNQIMQMVLLP